MLCTYPVIPSLVHVCIYFWFPLWLILEQVSLLWNVVLEVSGPFYSLITINYATNFNMNLKSRCFRKISPDIKNIRSYCFDTEKDWDGGIHLLLFAVRESVQESLGFSPFELVFGHSVRGPLKLLKEKFLSNDETPLNLLQYLSDFRNRLSKACEVARSNLKTSRGKMKAIYDNHVFDRKFKPGDKVLALLPIPGRPLQARYFGPYTIDKKTSDLNYIINTPVRRKNKQMCHVNMLKQYFDRDSSISKPITVVNTVP